MVEATSPLKAAFWLGRLWVRYRFHFLQARLLHDSTLISGPEEDLKAQITQEAAERDEVFGRICELFAQLPHVDAHAIAQLPTEFWGNIQKDDHVEALSELLHSIQHEREQDRSGDFIEPFFSADVRATLRLAGKRAAKQL